MATHTLMQPYYIGNMNHSQPYFLGGPEDTRLVEAATQTYAIGDLLYIDASGNVAICTSAGGAGTVLDSVVAGQAIKAANADITSPVHFRLIREGDLFAMNVWHTTAASAALAQTQLGQQFAIRRESSKWHVDIEVTAVEDADSSDAAVMVVAIPPKNPLTQVANTIGDIYGIVIVKFVTYSLASDGNPNRRVLQFGG